VETKDKCKRKERRIRDKMSQDVLYYQKKVDETVRKLGGYWKPLSGLARVMEELGELNELFIEENLDKEDLGGELADLFIITSSVGNQYCMNINEELIKLGYPIIEDELYQSVQIVEDKHVGLMKLCSIGGQIARILNHYDGDKKRKPLEKKRRLAEEITRFHLQLLSFSKLYDINLFQYVEKILERDLQRDKYRFNITHDPTTESSIEHFRILMGDEGQGFTKLWGSFRWEETKKLEENLKNNVVTFVRFAKAALIEGLDGFVLEVVGEEYILDEQKRNNTFKRIFEFFHLNDPKKENINEYLGLNEAGLYFTFHEQEFEWIPYVSETSLFILFGPDLTRNS